jgi:hypothetical protein
MWSKSCAVTEALAGPADGFPRFRLKFRLAGPPLSSIPPTGSNRYIMLLKKKTGKVDKHNMGHVLEMKRKTLFN